MVTIRVHVCVYLSGLVIRIPTWILSLSDCSSTGAYLSCQQARRPRQIVPPPPIPLQDRPTLGQRPLSHVTPRFTFSSPLFTLASTPRFSGPPLLYSWTHAVDPASCSSEVSPSLSEHSNCAYQRWCRRHLNDVHRPRDKSQPELSYFPTIQSQIHAVNMAQFLNSRSLNKWWKRLIVYCGSNFSINLMFFQSRTIGHILVYSMFFTYLLCLCKNFKFIPHLT